ncbi:F-box domain containing membrane protein, putative [Entamoeba histolytica HM-1:IMSS-B]|uniref:F-box domain containing membrane protein, putative n=6 Tax=Entamoeba histolytica TaxID=5759 RepID=C4LWF3_ENTH1|nr:F-box domain containing membrane protein, putative [Entamoeba histolytica HM-1:IMSS]EMD47636.1 F-box domain membrane protein [Entamoeba histolytica KU27]EMH77782.1 F-box domain containing membrane protein, putative [Entamoeba histolytica HM-1:IMSS-B]EMS11788.1 F-box domain containing membrane protein [Entamoeba histolytica HM-3:IMSS]ENY64813.1 F-box domain containing membrane protein [Entamoeba histolytica HM-1:IMSS-A]GAT93037.1 f-box domain containing membrane protein putative [Entamoeba h|eukprot:XP_656916.1 F-box domain containing membrane protein, putative [Entamoeba histolytica HM-1:IMSS]
MEFISLPESIKQKIYQNLLPCDLIQLGATCQTFHRSIYNDNLLCQLSLMDHYDEYVIENESEKLFDFEKFEKASASDCLNDIYPDVVKNYVNEQKCHFCHLNSFIPHTSIDSIQLSLVCTLFLYFIPYIRCLAIFSPLCIFVAYLINIKSQIQPTINRLYHKDRIIKKRLFYNFINHIEYILPFFSLPILLCLVFIHPILLLVPLGLFAFNFYLRPKLVPVLIGYMLSIIPIFISNFCKTRKTRLVLLITTSIATVTPLIIVLVSQYRQKPINLSEFVRRCINGLFIGGFISIIYGMTNSLEVATLIIFMTLSCAFISFKNNMNK